MAATCREKEGPVDPSPGTAAHCHSGNGQLFDALTTHFYSGKISFLPLIGDVTLHSMTTETTNAVDLAQLITNHYDVHVETLTFIQAENDSMWKVDNEHGPTHLARVTSKPTHPTSSANHRASFLTTLSTNKNPLPCIVPTKQQQLVVQLPNQCSLELCDWLPGDNITCWTPQLAAHAGSALAHFSNSSHLYNIPASHRATSSWRSYHHSAILTRGHKTLPEHWDPVLSTLHQILTPTIANHLSYCRVIHGDIHRENFIWNEPLNKIHLIDFADLGVGPPAYDFITTFSSLARLGHHKICADYSTSYQNNTRLPLPSLDELNILLVLRDIAIATHLISQKVNEEWVPARLNSLHQNCPTHPGTTHSDFEQLKEALR